MAWLLFGIVIGGGVILVGALWLYVAFITRAYLNDGEATWF